MRPPGASGLGICAVRDRRFVGQVGRIEPSSLPLLSHSLQSSLSLLSHSLHSSLLLLLLMMMMMMMMMMTLLRLLLVSAAVDFDAANAGFFLADADLNILLRTMLLKSSNSFSRLPLLRNLCSCRHRVSELLLKEVRKVFYTSTYPRESMFYSSAKLNEKKFFFSSFPLYIIPSICCCRKVVEQFLFFCSVQVFEPFGLFTGCFIKSNYISSNGKRQYGYAFVHFESSSEGHDCAQR